MENRNKSVSDRVRYLWQLRHELFIEELKKRGVYDMPVETLEDKERRAAQAWLAYVESLERWKKIVDKEPPEVQIALAKIMVSLLRPAYK